MRFGLPPFDRRDMYRPFDEHRIYRGRMMVHCAILTVAVLGVAFLLRSCLFAGLEHSGTLPYSPATQKQSRSAEAELAYSYQAVQYAVVSRLGSSGIGDTDWLQHRHEGHLGSYYHEGQVKISDWNDQEQIFYYEARVELGSDDNWELLSISVRKVR